MTSPQSTDQLSTLQMLLNQQLSEYREIKDLREKLRTAEMRHQALADEVQHEIQLSLNRTNAVISQ